MEDRYGRQIRSFRLSVTPKCNLKCFYCHKEGRNEEHGKLMSADEIGKIVNSSLEFGVRKIKISGGEPLLRTDLPEIIKNIKNEQIKDISLTTNGILLEKYAQKLKDAGLDRVNVSLDTLDPEQYKKITAGGNIESVKKGIEKAIEVGLTPLKVNFLAMDCTVNQLPSIMDYCRKVGAILQIIEFIPMETKLKHHHVDVVPIEEEFAKNADNVFTRKFMQNRKKYVIDGLEVEFVRPMDNTEFCNHCTRIRLTYDGYLKPCLLRDDNLVDVANPVRNGEDIRKYFIKCINEREPFCKP
ncbi:GTP 3',8-cyclase MoaA [Methanococcus maripaludis]|uniref:Probable GTP 3',8-cyclase n=1 Tax=Methanococcus maripaludis TaxID=39152 RepID=A0A7J9PBV4_METMI|nr:GTP 3',8-cyclase MoaA [Methanococcus maripaludis]MBA2860712.1 cyclic pyranopterin phosphate synthase [Methanococcus maripaludis]